MAETVGDKVLAALDVFRHVTAEGVATAIGVWVAAMQSVRTVASGIAAAATLGEVTKANARYQDVPLTPAVLADMAVRQIGDLDSHYKEAQLSGLNADRFGLLVEETGESYGIVDALRLWHRGSYLGSQYGITKEELGKVIYYSRVRDQFIPDLLKLSWDTMTGADAINTAVKGIVSGEQSQAWWEAAGGMPEQYEPLYEAAGDSVGVEHAVELHAHGLISEEELRAVILQSRINPRFYGVAQLANRRWLATYQVEQAVKAGAISPETGQRWLVEDGYPAEQAAAFSSAAASGAVHTHKAETEAIVLADYEAQIITEDEARQALADLGYTAAAIPFVLQSVVARRVITMRNAAINRLRTAYVAHLVEDGWVRGELATLGIPEPAIAQMLDAWSIEQATQVRRLSAAQVGKLAEDGYLTGADAQQRWVDMGYPPEEASLLLMIYQPGSKASPGATPVTTLTTGTATVEGG